MLSSVQYICTLHRPLDVPNDMEVGLWNKLNGCVSGGEHWTGLNSESVFGKQIEWRESATVDCSLNGESGLWKQWNSHLWCGWV